MAWGREFLHNDKEKILRGELWLEQQTRLAALGLSLCPYVERGTLHKLAERLGGVEAVWQADPIEWNTAVRIRDDTANRLNQWRASFDYGRSVASLKSAGIWYSIRGEESYPRSLFDLANPPIVLFGMGRRSLIDTPTCRVGVVGTRRASGYGLESATWIGETLSKAGCTVISGLALGIDGAAHKGALHGSGGTIAVLASGVDVCYPPTHRALYDSVLKTGAVVSEYPPGSEVAKHRFPERNRLIAALSGTLVVVQAGEKSGAMRTVDAALELGKEVYAVPGPITSVHYRGSNRLLQEGAQLLIDPTELLLDLGYKVETDVSSLQVPDRWQVLYEGLSEPTSAASLATQLDSPIANVYAGLLELELAGLVARGAGGFYQRVWQGSRH